MGNIKNSLSSIKTPYILSFLPGTLLSVLGFLFLLGIAETGTSSGSFMFLPVLIIISILINFLNPSYLFTYLYMRRNRQKVDNSAYHGLNIALYSIYFSTIVSILIEILVSPLFWPIEIIGDVLDAGSDIMFVGSEIYIRYQLYWTSLQDMVGGAGQGLGFYFFILLSFSSSFFFIIYGLLYFKRHFAYHVINEYQKRVSKVLLLLIITNTLLLFLIPELTHRYITSIFDKASFSGQINICEKINHNGLTIKCIEQHLAETQSIVGCNDLQDEYNKIMCINESGEYVKDWKNCYLFEESRINSCIYSMARYNDFFLDTDVCEALAKNNKYSYKQDGGSVTCFATIAVKKNQASLCEELKSSVDRTSCYEQFSLLRSYE